MRIGEMTCFPLNECLSRLRNKPPDGENFVMYDGLAYQPVAIGVLFIPSARSPHLGRGHWETSGVAVAAI
jgi:hypothetical protein